MGESRGVPPAFPLTVPAGDAGVRVDSFLHARFRNHSPARLSRVALTGGVTQPNGVPVTPRHRVQAGEELVVRPCEPPDWGEDAEPGRTPRVLFEDPWLLALDKPPGMICHPTGATTSGTVVHAVQAHLDGQTPRGVLRPGIVHRLDGATSGVLLLAKTAEAHAGLGAQFEGRTVAKRYVALVEGDVAGDAGRCDAPIGPRPDSALMTCGPDARRPKPAVTDWAVLARLGDATVVGCVLHTGRNHQIRVHLAALGHPVIGDAFYAAGGGLKWPVGGCPDPTRRHALHAAVLSVVHPVLGYRLTVRCGPGDFDALLREFRETHPPHAARRDPSGDVEFSAGP